MRILLLGGTGAIGTHLTDALNKACIDVYVTTRSVRCDHNKVYYIRGDAKNIQFLRSILGEEWDVVVDFMNYTVEELKERIDILLDNTKRYYFLSSSRVYADTYPITEDSPLLKDTEKDSAYLASKEYGLVKAEEEEILRKSGKTNWTIFRPYIIYSENRFQLGQLEKEDWLYRVIQGKSIILQKSLIDKKTTLTYSIDAAEVMSQIILVGNVNTEVYNIVGSSQCSATWGEIAEIYRDILQKYFNRDIAINYIDDNQAHLLRRGRSYYQTSHDRMFNRVFDNTKIKQYKDNNSYKSIRDGLYESLEKFLETPHFNFVNQAQEALIDCFTGDFSNIFSVPTLKGKLVYLYFRLFKTY